MVALKNERHVFLWRLSPHPVPKEAPVDVSLDEIIAIIRQAYDDKRAFAHLDSEGRLVPEDEATDAKNCIFISDIQLSKDKSALALLINRGDPDVAHPSFINPVQRTVTNVPPGEGEVQGWSAHLVISLGADGPGKYRAGFERIPNVSSTLVQTYIDALIDKITDGDPTYLYEKSLKRGKKTVMQPRVYKPRLGINRVPSETLEKDLQQGVLTGVTLIRTNPEYSGPGDPTVVKSVKEQVTVGVKEVGASRAMDFARSVVRWGRDHDYNEVQFKIQSLPGDRSSSPRFDLERADAMETLYARSKRMIGFAEMLETCYSQVHPEIAKRMLAELNDDTNW